MDVTFSRWRKMASLNLESSNQLFQTLEEWQAELNHKP